MVWLGGGKRLSIKLEVLVTDGELLRFDLLIGLDAIKQLGGMSMTSTGGVKFPGATNLDTKWMAASIPCRQSRTPQRG